MEFLLILWVLPGGWQMGGWGCGWVWVCVGVSHACMHVHTCICMHALMHMHIKHDKHAKHGCLHVSSHLQFLYMYTCTCMCMHVGTPLCPRCPQTPPPTYPLPRAVGSPKHQNSIIPELIKIFRFCFKILYL